MWYGSSVQCKTSQQHAVSVCPREEGLKDQKKKTVLKHHSQRWKRRENALLGTWNTYRYYTHKKSLLQEHACDDEGKKKGASRYFRRRWDVRVSGRVAHQAAGRLYTLSPSSKTPCPLSLAPREPCLFYPRLFGHMKLEKMMLIIWQTKRTLVDGSSWDPQGLFQKKITSVQDERDGSGQTCDRPRCT